MAGLFLLWFKGAYFNFRRATLLDDLLFLCRFDGFAFSLFKYIIGQIKAVQKFNRYFKAVR